MKKMYLVNGEQVGTLAEVAQKLHRSRVSKSDLEKYGVTTIESEDEEVKTEENIEPQDEIAIESQDTTDTSDKVDEQKDDTEEQKSENDKPFQNEAELVEVIKEMPDTDLEEWAKSENVPSTTYAHLTHKGIRRMRMIMAIKAYFFPENHPTTPAKVKVDWSKYDNSELTALCDSNKLTYTRVQGNEPIQRMWLIHALNKGGIVPTK